MGSSASKASRAAGSAARVYPTRAPSATTHASKPQPAGANPSKPGPTVRPAPQASETRDEAINLDAADPAFAASLRSLGAVQPNPHFSPSSTSPYDPRRSTPSSTNRPSEQQQPFQPSMFPQPGASGAPMNPALAVLAARERLQQEAEREFESMGKKGAMGREFLDVSMVRRVLELRARGKSEAEIEKGLDLKKGVVARLGARGIVEAL
ncbi:hypothetical protein K490DRAFT_63965 [Saccharata proteae CBS 121410]|uniref:Helix-turn-helix domain-containing protein n=1 Tax=Saccharata proteae CBS 121410 TaxID=1314787 RepID=A0A6A5YD14_9PEZI|nr:hypothetical protein K490DRAFT_63965 [Saccharata proteae CBS 121410]